MNMFGILGDNFYDQTGSTSAQVRLAIENIAICMILWTLKEHISR